MAFTAKQTRKILSLKEERMQNEGDVHMVLIAVTLHPLPFFLWWWWGSARENALTCKLMSLGYMRLVEGTVASVGVSKKIVLF